MANRDNYEVVVSLLFKLYEIKTWLLSGTLDFLVISENKIDASFPDSIFHVEGFRLCRSDRKAGVEG